MKWFLALFVFVLSMSAFAAESSVFNHSEVSVTTTSAQAIAANQSRKYLLVQNKGSTSVLLKVDSAHSASEGVEIPAGGNYEPAAVPLNAIFLKAASGTNACVVVEGK